MDNYQIDASLGLAVSLELLKKYKRSGLLHAEVRRAPLIGNAGKACLQLLQGATLSVYLEDAKRQRYPISEGDLIKLDKEKGPFTWSFDIEINQFVPQHNPRTPEPRSSSPSAVTSANLLSETGVPVIIAPLEWERINNWTQQQQQILYTLYRMIDGKKSIRDIKITTNTLLSASTVHEALQVLLKLKVIRITL